MPGSGRGRGQSTAASATAPPFLTAHPLRVPELRGLGLWLRRCLAQEVEQRRLFPWLAVGFGLGVLLFFAAEGRPALSAPLVGFGLFSAAAIALRRSQTGCAVALGLAAVFAGFAAGVFRQRSVDAPVLERLTMAQVSGFIETVDERAEGARIVVKIHDIAGLAAERRPSRVRITLRGRQALKPGDFIAVAARLLPPPEPARPGGYDFARDAYFRGIGAVGSVTGKVEIRPPPEPPGLALAIAARVDEARNVLTRRIADAIGGMAGAVAAALVTGKRGLIDEDTNDALRAAGIYHIVSISGLHMVLAAGVFFNITRALLALIPSVALYWPLKKIAAVVAMVGAAVYCVFSGSEVATERSLIMILVMLGAILADRPALSLRNLAISALIVLAREPEALLGPSFQMSYGAVAALVAAAEWVRGRWPPREWAGASRAMAWLGRASAAVLGSTLVASIATAPFGAYHFHTLNPFGLLGNALALPLVSLVVMPSAVLGVLAFPFGLDRPVWAMMGYAVDGVLRVSDWVSGLGGSTVLVAAFGVGALALLAAALLVVTLSASPLRWFALVPAALGTWFAAGAPREDILVDRAGSGAAVRAPTGRLVLLGRPPAFVVEQWLRGDGDARVPDDPTLRAGSRCDALGCTMDAADRRIVAFVADRRAFAEDCERAAVVLTRLPAPSTCKARLIIDQRFLATHGATAIRWGASQPILIPTRRPEDDRPWMRAPPPALPVAGPVSPSAERPPAARRPPRPNRDPLDRLDPPDRTDHEAQSPDQ